MSAKLPRVMQILDDLLSAIDSHHNALECDNLSIMVVLINGTVGVGKTSVGSALNEMYKDCLFIDGDAFYQHSTLNFANCDTWYSRWISIVCSNIDLHVNQLKDASKFVISYVFEQQQSILDLVRAIRDIRHLHTRRSVSVYSFLLHADLQLIHQRIRKRAASVYDSQDTQSLEWDLTRSHELHDILYTKHQRSPHSLGQLVDTSEFAGCKETAMHIKGLLDKYQHSLQHWMRNGNELKSELKALDFLNRFQDMIVTRKKCATTRWLKGERVRVEMKANQWVIGTVDDGGTPFGILHVHRIEEYKLNELTDRIANIENMTCSKELICVLKEIYAEITDEDAVKVVYFNCCHFV